MATNHSHELAPSRYPINREIDVTEKGRISPGTLTGLSWSVTVFCKSGCLVFHLHGPKTSSIERSGSWPQEKTKRPFVQKRRKGRKWRGTKKPERREKSEEEASGGYEGGGMDREKARARRRDGGKKGTMRRKIGTYIETDRGRKEKGLGARKGGGEPLPHCTLANTISPLSIRDSPRVLCRCTRITRHSPFDHTLLYPGTLLYLTSLSIARFSRIAGASRASSPTGTHVLMD